MLVISRYPKQAVYIGDDITVTVVSVTINDGRYHVRIGIDAPDSMNIARDDAVKSTTLEQRKRKRRL